VENLHGISVTIAQFLASASVMGVTFPETESDVALMERLAAGDTAALACLVKRHQDRVRIVAYRHTQRWDAADDIAQETFLRVWRAAATYRASASFTTWLYRVVVNLCLDWSRKPRLARIPESVPAPNHREAAAETSARVQAAVAALPERQRMVIVLHRFEAMSHQQIAEVTGWSTSAVESLVVRAYASLRQALSEENPSGSTQD
jgi:RNA polymerase sigma-70 factor, ECF subfamily